MVPTQRPADPSVCEAGRLLSCVAVAAPVHVVAGSAGLMVLLQAFDQFRFLLYVVTVAAVFLPVTVNAGQAKQLHVLLVMKGYHGTFIPFGMVDASVRHTYVRMQHPHDVSCVSNLDHLDSGSLSGVAYHAFGIVAPLTVTAHTLTMVGAFQAGLVQVLRIGRTPVAFPAGRYVASRRMMMTGRASFGHSFHLGVQSMGKDDRHVQVRKLVQDGYCGTLLRGVSGDHPGKARTPP